MVNAIDSGMWLAWLVRSSLQIAVLVVLILLVQWTWGRRLSGRWRHALWLLVMIRLLVPWMPSSSVSVFNLLLREKPNVSVTGPTQSLFVMQSQEVAAEVNPNEASPPSTRSETLSQAEPERSVSFAWKPTLIGLWLLGILWFLGQSLWSSFNLWRVVKTQRPVIHAEVLNLLEDSKETMGIQTVLGLVESDRVRTPALFGFVRPRLLLPKALLTELSLPQLRHVFLHELAHFKRHDVFLGWLSCLLQAMHWFNPWVWWAFYRMRTEREMAADQLALSYLDATEVTAYGETILVLLQRFVRPQVLPVLAGMAEQKTNIERRMTMIAEYRGETRFHRFVAMITLMLLALTALTNAKIQTLAEGTGPELIAMGQLPVGEFTLSFTADTEDGRGHGEGNLRGSISGGTWRWDNCGSHTSNTVGVPIGSVSLYWLRFPEMMLKFPVQAGNVWVEEGDYRVEIKATLDYTPVHTQAGVFKDCLLIITKIDATDQIDPGESIHFVKSLCGTRYIWLARGVGIVRLLYEHQDGTTTDMILTDYKIAGESSDYWPMLSGTTWDYTWKNDGFSNRVTREHWTLKRPDQNEQPFESGYRDVILKENPFRGWTQMVANAESESGKHWAKGGFDFQQTSQGLSIGSGGTVGSGEGPGGYMLIRYLYRDAPFLFKEPMEVGGGFQYADDDGYMMQTVYRDWETITVPAGTFKCMPHVTTIMGASKREPEYNRMINGQRTLWFAPGVGLVKMRYEHSNGKVTQAELINQTGDLTSDSLFPLDPGLQWVYRWSNEYYHEPVIETIRVPARGDVVHKYFSRPAQMQPRPGDNWKLLNSD